MRYRLYRLEFPNGVHFGKNSLDSAEYTFAADILFSALCQEAVKKGGKMLDTLLSYVNRDMLCFSDAFPYMKERYYLPRPLLYIENTEQRGDSVLKKAYKKLKYIPADLLEDYLKGEFLIKNAGNPDELGEVVLKVSASVRGEEETKPYRVGIFYYNEKCGLYIIVGYEDEAVLELLESLLETLSLSGIGGKRMAGLGRFNVYVKEIPSVMEKRLCQDGKRFMTLSVSLPQDDELERAVEGANYLLEKRSGFVASENYAEVQMRKRDLYVFAAGSCFDNVYKGGIYDVSSYGKHPVYRYAKPMFMGGGHMKQHLTVYRMKLKVLGPVFVGSGKELSKKEYMFLDRDKIGVVAIEKLYPYFQKRKKQREFEDFLLKNQKSDLKKWILEQRMQTHEIEPYMKYVLDSGDTSLVRGTKTQIMEFVKDAYGMPYIPGSSLKGMFRTILLSSEVMDNKEKYSLQKNALVAAANERKKRNIYLAKEEKQLEMRYYHSLNRLPEKRGNAVNDSMSGFIISDSEPLSMNDMVLCQKIERHVDGTEKRLNLLRECIRPGTDIYFTITVDESICKITMEKLMKTIENYIESYYDNFLSAFQGMNIPGKASLYLGGGCGFVSKTIIYPLYGKEQGIDVTQKIFRNTNVPREHRHYKDTEYGASPHIVKCTRYQGKTVQMGLCSLSER